MHNPYLYLNLIFQEELYEFWIVLVPAGKVSNETILIFLLAQVLSCLFVCIYQFFPSRRKHGHAFQQGLGPDVG